MTRAHSPEMLPAVSLAKKVVSTLALTVAILFTVVVVLTTGELFFGSSKIKPLFGMSQDALAQSAVATPDAGARRPTYFNATKSAVINFPRPDGGL